MHGLTRMRFLGGVLLTVLIALLATDPAPVFAQKKKRPEAPVRPDPTKVAPAKSAVIVPVADHSTLPDGKKLTALELSRHIDTFIAKKLAEEKVIASPLTTDEEFLRRVYLDLTGKIPSHEQAVRFLDSKEQDRRARLIDELLASKEFGKHQADVWQALLLPRSSDNVRQRQWYPHMTAWLTEKFNGNVGWDKIVKGILTAEGEVDKTSPAVYWIANPTADKVTDNVTRMFLGVQLQCAQCHNHPFTDWKQDEYWGMAAFFLKVRPEGNPKAAAKNGGTIKISEVARPINNKKRMLPESAKILPPKFLQGEHPRVSPTSPVRPVLADWMVSAKNPFFARAMVNRSWGLLFGRGFVNPIDDIHDGNEASHPELLADLAKQFATNDFDLKYFFRAVCNSTTYQRSSKPISGNADVAPELFARMAIKPLTPEQLYDSITGLVGASRPNAVRAKAAGKGQGNQRDQFVAFFGAEDGADPTEYQSGIPQVLRLMNAPQLNNASIIAPILRESKGMPEMIERLYLSVLARRPRQEELVRVTAFIRKTGNDRRESIAGVLWALMNSSEFALNR